jgi:hypothetical protein
MVRFIGRFYFLQLQPVLPQAHFAWSVQQVQGLPLSHAQAFSFAQLQALPQTHDLPSVQAHALFPLHLQHPVKAIAANATMPAIVINLLFIYLFLSYSRASRHHASKRCRV